MWHKIKNELLVRFLSSVIDHKRLMKLQAKFPIFSDLLQLEQKMRKDKAAASSASGMGQDVDPEELRPWKKLPNIRDFAIKVRPYDWVFLLFGILKRFPPELDFVGWRNATPNRYVDYMFKRLRREVELKLYDEALVTMWMLMNSSAYLAVGLNYVCRNWHRRYPIVQVESWIKQIKKLVKDRATWIDYKRVYMQEPTKWRPLGVPTMPWRVYLHMYNNILTQWRLVSEGSVQHAYLPGRGVITAWNALVHLLKEPNIFEADFKGFFDNVTHSGIQWVLRARLKLPESEIDFLARLMESLPVFPFEEGEEGRLPEPDLDFLSHPKESREVALGLPAYLLRKKRRGVPQGAPISCSLATLALRPVERGMKCLAYADDTLLFPKRGTTDPRRVLSQPLYGLVVREDRSRFIKRDGVWLVEEFKFLGVTYKPAYWIKISGIPIWRISERFIASTRKGASLEFSNRESFLSFLSKARDGILAGGSAGRDFFMKRPLRDWIGWNGLQWINLKSKAALLWNNRQSGWILSRMFIDSWESKEKQDFNLTYDPDSWMGLCWPIYADENSLSYDNISVFTASSFACNDLLRMIDYPFKYKKRKKNKFRVVHSWTYRRQEEIKHSFAVRNYVR